MRLLLYIAFLFLSLIIHAAGTRFEDGVEAYQNNDYLQAFAIFLPLAQAGNVDAQLSVGTMYDRGQGVEQDSQEALKWYSLAADQGDEIAKSLMKTLFNSAQGATDYHDDRDTLKDLHGVDNTISLFESLEQLSPSAERADIVHQILNKSRLAILNPPEKKQLPAASPPAALFNQQTYQKIKYWVENSLRYLAAAVGFLVFCFTLFHLFKRRKPRKSTPILYPYVQEEEESNPEETVLDELFENIAHEPPPALQLQAQLESQHEPASHVNIVEEAQEIITEDTGDLVEKERLFEYCYNHHAYDEKKLNENPIVKIQRRRYKGSFMEYCYEECYN